MTKTQYNRTPSVSFELRSPDHQFGGDWTSEKLEHLGKYLEAFTKVFKKQPYLKPVYIDAFAGSGLIKLKSRAQPSHALFPELAEESVERFIEGSARVALNVEPAFHRYIFVDTNKARIEDLNRLKALHPAKASSIAVHNKEANDYLLGISHPKYWKAHRAVLFLDPYGMQVKWSTLEAIASTGAIDLWYLFPLGVGVNRLLKTNGQIEDGHQLKLDELFGTKTWRNSFYQKPRQMNLLEADVGLEKVADFDAIEQFFVTRLKTLFPFVAQQPLRLYNSKGNPIFSFCFASANQGKGGQIALRIANHLLQKSS